MQDHHDDQQDDLHHDHLHVTGTARLRAYWLGSVDARPLGLFRIALGLVVLVDAIDRLRDFTIFYTDDGMFARVWLARLFPETPLHYIASLVGSPAAAALLFAVGITAALLLTLGLCGRWPALVVWLYFLTLHERAPFVVDGGDGVMAAMTFWAIFTDADAAFSLRRGPRIAAVRALPVRLAECQLMLVYLVAGARKLNQHWIGGAALFHVLQDNDYARPLGMALLEHPSLCRLLTWATLVVELGFAPLVLAWPRRGRGLGAAMAAGLHLGIYALMRVGMFSFAMLASLCLFVPPERLGAPVALPSPSWPRRWRVTAALAGALFSLVAANALLARHTPAPIMKLLARLELTQGWSMFQDSVASDGYWSGTARDRDGRSVDAFGELAPAVLPQTTLRFSRWFKLRENMVDDPRLRLLLLDWMCGRRPLAEVSLERWERPTRDSGAPSQAFTRGDVTTWRCRDRSRAQ